MDELEPPPARARAPLLPGFDPVESPLFPGGHEDDGERLASVADHLKGLVDSPSAPHPRRALYRVRREGWVARRDAARERFRDLHAKGAPSSGSRILAALLARSGVLDEARGRAVRARFVRGTRR